MLADQVKVLCDRLAAYGWRDLLLRVTGGQLDIAQRSAADLRAALLTPLTRIDRQFPGFVDFAQDGTQGVSPGSPARSLLYHALASPGVRTGVTGPLDTFPTLHEIDVVENFVFGVEPPTLAELRRRAGQGRSGKLAVVLFAYEYRPAADTCSRAHADLAFSRTGIARVGTRPPLYRPDHRGFQSEVEEEPFAFRVCPSKFAPFLAVRLRAGSTFAPMRPQDGDGAREFWVPIHKLFDGPECVRGFDLQVAFQAFHYNDKIRRIHVQLGANPPEDEPFQLRTGIADLAADRSWPPGVVRPTIHSRLVEPALLPDRSFATFRVPAGPSGFAAFEPPARSVGGAEVRPAPAYVHARTEVKGQQLIDLNVESQEPDIRVVVGRGNYDALHYLDFTGEGQVDARVSGLPADPHLEPQTQPAYSLVCAPDFFPSAGQRELTEWGLSPTVPASIRPTIWGVDPVPLCDIRLPANLQMPGNRFSPGERTVTAVVPLLGTLPASNTPPIGDDALRHSCLPDDAAGVFAPGWDVSTDEKTIAGRRIHHLAAYGLGSPFPEDSKLCAALSTFWASVAPDVTRGMSISTGNDELRHTVAPLTDEEIGQGGGLPWDGNPGPTVVTLNGQDFAECRDFLRVDYVQAALNNRFTSRLTARVTAPEYERRMLAMAYTYRVIGGDPNGWFVLSFRLLQAGDPELQRAQIDASIVLPGVAYRVEMFRSSEATEQVSPTDIRRRLLPIRDRRFFIVDPKNRIVLQRRTTPPIWSRAVLSL